jgi:hypothetical protein
MKNYQSNQKLVHAFATFQSYEGRANNMFFKGSTIYSYGEHFPIATRTDEVTFFNLNKYSNTTAKHKSLVRSGLSRYDKIFLECVYVPTISEIEYNILDKAHKYNLGYWEKSIALLTEEIENPRTRNKATRQFAIEQFEANRNKYKTYFNI